MFLADEFIEGAWTHPGSERRSAVDLRGGVGLFPGKQIVHKRKYGVPADSAPDFVSVRRRAYWWEPVSFPYGYGFRETKCVFFRDFARGARACSQR